MEQEILPAGRLAPGRRRLSADSVQHEIAAREFVTLPDGVTSPHALLAAVKKARVPLGIPATLLELLDLLFGFTEAQDWQAGGRPIVWPSNRFLADQLGISRSGVQKRIQRSVLLGLFVMKDAPNGQRHGRRDPKTRQPIFAESFGFDLAPLAIRYQEFYRAGLEHRAAYRAREGCRKRGFIAKSALLQLIETADTEGLWSSYWEAITERLPPLFAILEDSDGYDALATVTGILTELRAEAEALLTAAMANPAPAAGAEKDASSVQPSASGTVDNRSMGGIPSTLKNTTDPISLSEDTGMAWRGRGSGSVRTPPQPTVQRTGSYDASPADRVAFEDRVAVSVILDAVPDLASFCPTADATWNDVADAAQRLCAHWTISQRNWAKACQALGRTGAALAFAVMVHQHSRGGIASPGGYFYRMIERAENGTLDLVRSYHGIRTRLYGPDRRTRH